MNFNEFFKFVHLGGDRVQRLIYKGDNKFVVEETPQPIVGVNEVLVEMRVAALCGSDLHIKEQHDVELKKDPTYRVTTPSHEPAGVVAQVGEGVETLKVGDRVAVYHKIGCMACPQCISGNIVMCDSGGAFGCEYDGAAADYMVVPKENCLLLPEPLSFTDGAIMMCAGGTAFSAFEKVAPTPGQTIAIIGCGPLGLAAIILAKAYNLKVFAIDIGDERLKLAEKLGADFIYNSHDDAVEEGVYDLVHGFIVPTTTTVKRIREECGGRGVDLVMECSSSLEARNNGVDLLAQQGKMVLLGINNSFRENFNFQQSLAPDKLIFKEIQIFGSNVFSLPLYYKMVDFMVSNKISFEPLVSHTFSLQEGQEAFDTAAKGSSGKVILTWE